MNTPLFSIITPVYNGEAFLAETIRSVRAQTRKDWEMLIVDDGSRDRSAGIAEDFASKDPRIRVLRTAHAGCTAARNCGLREAAGRYLLLLDADDLWDPVFLQEQLTLMEHEHAAFVCSGYRCIDRDSRPVKAPVIPPVHLTYETELRYCHVGCLTAMYDSAAAGKIFLDERLQGYCDDYALWLAILKAAGPGCGSPKVLASYRISPASLTANKFKRILPHYRFHRRYCGLGFLQSLGNTLLWMVRGIRKYYGPR